MPLSDNGAVLDRLRAGDFAEDQIRGRSLDRLAYAHDASHYLLVPEVVVTPSDADEVGRLLRDCVATNTAVTFRSGGTSLSGQAQSSSMMIDTRRNFQSITVLDGGDRVRVQPGLTVRQVNTRLLRFGRKLGPDPASESACTIGGVIANNSSGMACGIADNSYRTVESLVLVLPSGTVIDTADANADDRLRDREPALYAGIAGLRDRIRSNPTSMGTIARQFSMKNTMGYGINSLVDHDSPVQILAHLMIGSEGTLGFVAEATFRTVPLYSHSATGLLIFDSLTDATMALPDLVASGFATAELMDAASLRVAGSQADAPAEVRGMSVGDQAALLVEHQAGTPEELQQRVGDSAALLARLPLQNVPDLTTDPAARADLWHMRKGLYAVVAGARPSGTNALLEDVVVPVADLAETCTALTGLFARHEYGDSVIFGHAKDGNIHFMLNERFDDPASLARYERFTDDMVDLVLARGGSLKAEHGTGRIMAPFVRRQYGDELYGVMTEIKHLVDPTGVMNPGVIFSEDSRSYVQDLKSAPTVEEEVDRCVECGYCEPVCPSRNLTMTPRQRIALRREMQSAIDRGDDVLARELRDDYDYDGVQTCAVDGMCSTACPVLINTGDLVRRLREENANPVADRAWSAAATNWKTASVVGGRALSLAASVPAVLPRAATDLGRALLGADTVPRYTGDLPGGGTRRVAGATSAGEPVAVYFASCITTMFGPADDGEGVRSALLRLCERAGITLLVPDGIEGMCCGTPWKSKGMHSGYESMSSRVIEALVEATDGGRLPIVCDAVSCTEGLEVMSRLTADAPDLLRFVDAVEFVEEQVMQRLVVSTEIASIALHPTCSSTQLGTTGSMLSLARAISPDVVVPDAWGCCAFAGDRGMLHPELTASATREEADELLSRDFAAYASSNRTCELGMSRATKHDFVHVLELVERATRPLVGQDG